MATTEIGRQITKFVKRADKFVADIITGARELREAAKEIKQAWKGEEGNNEKRNKT